MGVTRTYRYSGKNLTKELQRLQSYLELMQAQEKGNWNVNVSVMYHKNLDANPCSLLLVSLPLSQIVVLRSLKEETSYKIMQGDMNLSSFIENIQCFKVRQQFNINGKEYELGDFKIRFGLAFVGSETRYLVAEIEFAGIKYLSYGRPSISEFIGYLDPKAKLNEIVIEYHQKFEMDSENFTPKHSAIDMLLALNCLNIR
ncbi:unnamed protein product [Blepharisma stoltei]|uniref:Mediator of RNA polymerase II transcription subunit 20 n=1 Tax=Blepharisma stoltei TaxID=1481888 RepID=A0AAU9JFR1_9CILI|nr:unnamed protein product [Blepharisma stoltei]